MQPFHLRALRATGIATLVLGCRHAAPPGAASTDAAVTIAASHLLDGRGAAQRDVVIVVERGRIVRIQPRASFRGAVTHDLSGLTVLPGLIDVHDHIDWHFTAAGRYHTNGDGETPEQSMRAAYANMEATLRAGFTTIQSPGARIDAALRDSVHRGAAVGPRILTSLGQISGRAPDQLRAAVRQRKEQGADLVKIFASASIRDGGTATMTQEQLDAACGEAKALGIRSMVHAHSAEAMRYATLAGCDQIEHGVFATADVLRLMAERGTYFSPQCGLVFRNYLEHRARFEGIGSYNAEGFAAMERAVPVAIAAVRAALATPGLKVVYGTDAVAGAHGRNVEDIYCRVRDAGESPMQAIVAATSLSAASLGLGTTIGTLAPGFEADIIAVDGDPLADITALGRVAFVMRGGTVYRTDRRAARAAAVEWPVYGGDAGGMKYSPLADIDRDNVTRLAPAWTWRTGEQAIPETDSTRRATPGNFQATPLMIDDVLYLTTPFNRVVALDARTGALRWSYDPRAYAAGQPSNGTGFVHRGVATWTDGRERRIFVNSRWRLIALDAGTGTPIRSFGANGEVSLIEDLIWPVRDIHYTNTSPPVVYRDLVIVGNGVGDRLTYPNDPPGDVQAFDVRTGKRVWRFSPIPQGSDFGVETWEDGSSRRIGHTNVWAPFTVDVQRGLVYLPVGTPSNDWYGGERKGNNLFAESIVCLDANTGRRVWHFQTVHHGLWDYDLPAPPSLITVRSNGRPVDAVAVPTKMGFLFVFDRVTGAPLWPIEERPVPPSDVPGERASPTQPFPTRPAPFAQQGMTENDVVDFTPAIRALAIEELRKWRSGPIYTPPSLHGTVVMPGVIGGAGWGGGAFDPETGIYYVKATNQAALAAITQMPRSDTINAPYSMDRTRSNVTVNTRRLTDSLGLPAGGGLPINKPPYGTLTAIDLNTGDHRWQVPVGDTPGVRRHPLLQGMNLPPLGVAGSPGPIVTRGGLVFLTGGGSVLYAFDSSNGRVLWEHDLGRSGYSVPMTFRTSTGVQFVVIATGSGANAELVAFSLRGTRE